MASLQRKGVYALRAPIPPGILLRINVGGDVAVRCFVHREGYVPGG